MSIWLFVLPVVSVVAGLLQFLAYLRAERRWRLGIAIARHRHAFRAERRREAGAQWHVVRVDGMRLSIGSSIESPNEMSATPALRSDEAMVVDASGRVLRIQPGETMHVTSLPGARRNLVEAITTKSNVEQRFSFELDPDRPFKILGVASKNAAKQPFRDTPATDLAPFEGAYLVGAETDEEEPKAPDEPGCGGRLSARVVLGTSIAGACLSFVPYVGVVAFGVALVVAGLWLLAHLIDALDPPKLDVEPPEVQARVRAELAGVSVTPEA